MDKFQITTRQEDDIVIMYVKEFIDAHTALKFESSIDELIKQKKYKIILNFKDLNYISSAGLGVLMGFIEEVRDNGGDFKLVGLTQKVHKIFNLLGFTSLYDIFDSEEEAIQKFKKDSNKN